MACMSVTERAIKGLIPGLAVMAAITAAGAPATAIYVAGLALIAAVAVYAVVVPTGVRRPLRPLPARRQTPAQHPTPNAR